MIDLCRNQIKLIPMMKHSLTYCLVLLCLSGWSMSVTPAMAAPPIISDPKNTDAADADEAKAEATPLPRYGILRYNEVNARTGPGTRYPIEWVYRHAGVPVEVTERFDMWVKIRDAEEAVSWVHKSKIRWQRRGMNKNALQEVYTTADEKSPVVARLMAQVLFDVKSCNKIWCQIAGKDNDGREFEGYVRQTSFFGVYPQEQLP